MEDIIEKRFIGVDNSKTFKNIVDKYNLSDKSVLDIGCSYGEFLAHFGEGSIGLTISHEEEAYAKNRGLDVRYGNIESDKVPVSEKFDIVFANNIFEHLYSPHAFLIDVKKYIKSDGKLILGVPCIPAIEQFLIFNKFRGSLAVGHINFFKKSTLIKTVERAGWNIISVRSFHWKTRGLDRLLDIIAPHFYITAKVDEGFEYHEKRKKELDGYDNINKLVKK